MGHSWLSLDVVGCNDGYILRRSLQCDKFDPCHVLPLKQPLLLLLYACGSSAVSPHSVQDYKEMNTPLHVRHASSQ